MAATLGFIFFGFTVFAHLFGGVTEARNICASSTGDLHAPRHVSLELTSPNYPFNYPNSKSCSQTITTKSPVWCVQINMAQIDLESTDDSNCPYDVLSFYNGSTTVDRRLIKKMCGQSLGTQPITFNSSIITVLFKTDGSVQKKGFRLKYEAVLCRGFPRCSRSLTADSGTVTSPGYPLKYPDNSNCYLYIQVPSTCRAKLVFTTFQLESQPSCTYDSLEIFDGYLPESSKSVGKYCGSSLPALIMSSTNELLLYFVTDGSVTEAGFSAQYSAVCPSACNSSPCQNGGYCETVGYDSYRCHCQHGYGGHNCDTSVCFHDVISGSGRIVSPGYPRLYPNSLLCDFRICATETDFVVLRFDDFRVQDSHSCSSDRLEIFDGDSPTSSLIGVYCGQLSTILVNSTHECLFVRFTADRHSGASGFQAQYYSVAQGQALEACSNKNGGCEQLCVSGDFGDYTCACRPGYRLEKDGYSCEDVDECIPALKLHDCEFPATCVNTRGSYYCQCNRNGYRLGNDSKSCVDVDECSTPEVHACSQQCHNTESSYFCGCNSGYVLTSNAKQCEDIDECASSRGGCDHRCHNTPGSFECRCRKGFKQDSKNLRKCVDEDECALSTEEQCPRCKLTKDNWYRCNCPDGFQQAENPVKEGYGCIDINECEVTQNICGRNARCLNTEGSYTCNCKVGFVNGSSSCIDINECITENGGCEDTCVNDRGSYHCACSSGYSLTRNKHNCTDINECTNGAANCSQSCENTEGSYTCSCNSGFVLDSDGQTCNDLNECEAGIANCSQFCNNTGGSYYCSCESGYRLLTDRHQCRDINECAVNNGGCDHRCHNFPGGYSCRCHVGYTTDDGGITCNDIDECQLNPCNMTCQNTNGSYYCECPSPQFLLHSNGQDCIDVDECQTNNGGCQQLCMNTYGGRECMCYEGYRKQGRHGRGCRDIDECSTGEDSCHHNCINTVGSYNCSCRNGFLMQADGRTCVDINECALNSTGCNQLCENLPGGYRCLCFSGFEVNSDDFRVCDDINECLDNNGNCSGGCVNIVGSYECTCEIDEKLGVDQHTCSACPTCSEFQTLQSSLREMRTLIMQLKAKVHKLEVASIQNNVPESEPNSVSASSRSAKKGA